MSCGMLGGVAPVCRVAGPGGVLWCVVVVQRAGDGSWFAPWHGRRRPMGKPSRGRRTAY